MFNFKKKEVLEKGGLIVECSTHDIRLAKGDEAELTFAEFQNGQEITFRIQELIYSAWYFYCKRILEIDQYIEEMRKADFTPIYFRIVEFSGQTDFQGHARIDRLTGTAVGNWQEQCWGGKFSFALEGIAFSDIPLKRDFSAIKPVIGAFLKIINDGVISIGSSSSGKGRVTIENFEEVSKALLSSKISGKVRCTKGHNASRQKRSFGGKCKCGADIRPAWTIPLYDEY